MSEGRNGNKSEGRNGNKSGSRSTRVRDPDVYYIAGHGGEGGLKKIRLPEGCTVIVRPKPGQYSLSEVVAKLARALFCAKSDVYRHPLENLRDVVNTVGSVAVYTEGELCPNFKFKLLTNYSRHDYEYISPVSGLIPLPKTEVARKRVCEAFSREPSKYKDTVPAIRVLPQHYEHSAFPTEEDVREIIHTYSYEDENNNDNSNENNNDNENDEEESNGFNSNENAEESIDLLTVLEDDDSPFFVHLSDLLDLQPDGTAGRPGIFYNFSCRSTRDISGVRIELYDYERLKGEGKKGIIYPIHGERIPRALPPLEELTENEREKLSEKNMRAYTRKKTASNVIRQLLFNTIAEAEGKRKHLIPGTRFNRPPPLQRLTRRKRKQRTRAHRRLRRETRHR